MGRINLLSLRAERQRSVEPSASAQRRAPGAGRAVGTMEDEDGDGEREGVEVSLAVRAPTSKKIRTEGSKTGRKKILG